MIISRNALSRWQFLMACDYSLHFNHAFLMSKFKGGGVLETLEDLLEYRKN